jgi:REP element-mobilizing transposase RayT
MTSNKRCLHFITFRCHHRDPLLSDPQSCTIFEQTLERVRRWYGFFVTGYVVMPEHVHQWISEPERGRLSIALQMLKQITAQQLRLPGRRALLAATLLRFQRLERSQLGREAPHKSVS